MMTSQSLEALARGVKEIDALRKRYPVPRGHLPGGEAAIAAKAHGRACVVLLSSHWERYFYAVNEEAVSWINSIDCRASLLPEELRLRHSQGPLDEITATAWNRRSKQLRAFVASDAALWQDDGLALALDHGRLLSFMKAPFPQEIARYYKQFGIENIFKLVTRTERSRGSLYLDLKELVEKRNNIAHGDAQTEALPIDVTRYMRAVSKFAPSADRVFARRLKRQLAQTNTPW